MNVRLKIAASIWRQLREHHLAPNKVVEALSYVFARTVLGPDSLTVLVPHNARVILFGPDCYVHQAGGNVRLRPDVLNGMLVQFAAAGEFNTLINWHAHWFADKANFSGVDNQDDISFDRYLRDQFEPMLASQPHIGPKRPIYNVSVVLAKKECDARFTDVRRKPVFKPINYVDVVGDGFERQQLSKGPTTLKKDSSDTFSRQQDFIGTEQQDVLGTMHGILVGAGGLGSIQGEALGRSGVGALTIIENDFLDRSNLNRWLGALPHQIGKLKSEILAERLRQMFPAMDIRTFNQSVFEPSVEGVFAEADFLVGAVDNDPARFFLNAASLQYMLPYFDAGVSVTVGEDTDFLSRYFAVLPGTSACVECSRFQFVDWGLIDDAFVNKTTLTMRRAAGYVVDHPEVSAPSVFALNQRASSTLTTEFLNWICGWRPAATSILESWRQGTIQRADRNNFPETPAADCPTCGYRSGAGDSEKLPRPPEYRDASSVFSSLQDHFKELKNG